MDFVITSDALGPEQPIPSKYTCEGADVSPPLAWRGVPAEAKSLVLLCDDPDSAKAPWSHWVLYDIPPDKDRLPEGVPPEATLPWGGIQGRNDFGNLGYGGPCPQVGLHHYYFRLYALDRRTELPPRAMRQEVLDRIRDHVVAQTELMGTYILHQ